MSVLQFSCPHCTGIFEVDDSLLGHEIVCPSCTGAVVLSTDIPPDLPDDVPPPLPPGFEYAYPPGMLPPAGDPYNAAAYPPGAESIAPPPPPADPPMAPSGPIWANPPGADLPVPPAAEPSAARRQPVEPPNELAPRNRDRSRDSSGKGARRQQMVIKPADKGRGEERSNPSKPLRKSPESDRPQQQDHSPSSKPDVPEPIDALLPPTVETSLPPAGVTPPLEPASMLPPTAIVPPTAKAETGSTPDDANLIAVKDTPKVIGEGPEARQVRRLSPEEKYRRRQRRNLIMLILGLIILTTTMALLLNL